MCGPIVMAATIASLIVCPQIFCRANYHSQHDNRDPHSRSRRTARSAGVGPVLADGAHEPCPDDGDDRRARVIAVTPAGARKVRAAEKVLDAVREDVLAALPNHEREVFLRALGRLACGRLSAPVACTQPVRRRS